MKYHNLQRYRFKPYRRYRKTKHPHLEFITLSVILGFLSALALTLAHN